MIHLSKVLGSLVFMSAICIVSNVPLDAAAQESTECPETAEQALFNMTLRARAGQVSDIGEVFNLANTALTLCPDRDEVQGLAVELFAMVATSLEAPADRFVVWSKAYEAAVNNHNAFDYGTSPVVKLPDGTDRTLYPYAAVNGLMKDYITSNLFELWLLDHSHFIFDDTPLTECPYNNNQGRVRSEVQGLRNAGARLRPQGGGTAALRRIYHLKAVCLKQTSFINLMLAELHAEVAKFAIARQRRDVAVDHAAASLALFEEFGRSELTDNEDKPVQLGIQTRIETANELLAAAAVAEQIDVPE